jgi:hypothetical protein
MVDFYGSAEAVITRTGVKPEDLGFDGLETGRLEDFLEELLTEMSDLMDRSMRKSYLAETIPAGLNGLAADIAADAVREMVATRQTPVVRIDDFAVRVIRTNVFSPDAEKRMKLYAAGRGVVSVDLGEDQLAPLPDTMTAASLADEL